MEATNTTARVFRYDDRTPEAWGKFITAMHSGERFECDEEMFYYWLEVLPPVFMGKTVTVGSESRRVSFGFAEGREPITVFWREGDRYFGQRTDMIHGSY